MLFLLLSSVYGALPIFLTDSALVTVQRQNLHVFYFYRYYYGFLIAPFWYMTLIYSHRWLFLEDFHRNHRLGWHLGTQAFLMLSVLYQTMIFCSTELLLAISSYKNEEFLHRLFMVMPVGIIVSSLAECCTLNTRIRINLLEYDQYYEPRRRP